MGKRKVKVFLVGDGPLRAKLDKLTTKQSGDAIRKATREALKIVQWDAKRLAPKATGALRRSIKVRALKRSRKRIGARVSCSASDNAFTGKTFYGAFQEYGWRSGKRASNATLGLTKGKRRTADQKAEIERLNNARKKNPGKHFLKDATDRRRNEVLEMFNHQMDEYIRKVMS